MKGLIFFDNVPPSHYNMAQLEARVAAIINRLSDKELMEFKVQFLGMSVICSYALNF